jgi:hypothetical protein
MPARHVKPELVAGESADCADRQSEPEIELSLLYREAGKQQNRLALEQSPQADE